MEVDIRRKRKIEQSTDFTERMKQIQEKAGAALKRAQEEIKKQADRERRKDKVILSTKDLEFKEQTARKLVDHYVGPYTIDEIVSTNVVKWSFEALPYFCLVDPTDVQSTIVI